MRGTNLLALAGILLLFAASSVGAAEKPALGAWGVETKYVDADVRPGDDFYRHVNNGWLKTARIPEGFANANGFIDAALATEGKIDGLIAEIAASDPAPGSDEALIKALYQSYTDMDRRNALGLSPIEDDLKAILSITSHDDVARWMAKPFAPSIVGAGVESDPGEPQRYIPYIWQGELGLPSREYYLLPGDPYAGHRVAYRQYIKETFDRAGIDGGADRAEAIVAIETAIAEIQWTPSEMRDAVRMYHLMTADELKTFAPQFPWDIFLQESGFAGRRDLDVMTDTAIQKLAVLFAETPVETWRSYLAFHYIDAFVGVASEEWVKARFDFWSRKLQGIERQRPLKVRAVEFVSDTIGEVVGKAYVARHFPPVYRTQMQDLVANVRAAYRARIEKLAWMDEETRKQALAKLDGVTSHIGYPDRWHDFSSLRLAPDALIGNVRAIRAFELADSLKALDEPRRDWEWAYSPQTVNAGYMPSLNSITFPAAILQPPFFDPNADPAVNYGAAGAVIGHELGHAFDDQGSRSDASGALRNWWTDGTRAEFDGRAAVLVEQFGVYSPLEGLKVNGSLTLGENIGDLGGLTVAYDAYQLAVAKEPGGKAPVIDGYTGNQRFFLSWAQVWRELSTPDVLRENLLSDPHSPSEFRVNGALRNVDGWYEAFGVKEGDELYLPPDKRARIW